MTVDEYYAMVIVVLMGLTFIAFLLVFLYMIYGEKEETMPTPKSAALNYLLKFALIYPPNYSEML